MYVLSNLVEIVRTAIGQEYRDISVSVLIFGRSVSLILPEHLRPQLAKGIGGVRRTMRVDRLAYLALQYVPRTVFV